MLLRLGDLNNDLSRCEQITETARYLNDLNAFGRYPLISLPTRIIQNTASIMDDIFTNDFCHPITSGGKSPPL